MKALLLLAVGVCLGMEQRRSEDVREARREKFAKLMSCTDEITRKAMHGGFECRWDMEEIKDILLPTGTNEAKPKPIVIRGSGFVGFGVRTALGLLEPLFLGSYASEEEEQAVLFRCIRAFHTLFSMHKRIKELEDMRQNRPGEDADDRPAGCFREVLRRAGCQRVEDYDTILDALILAVEGEALQQAVKAHNAHEQMRRWTDEHNQKVRNFRCNDKIQNIVAKLQSRHGCDIKIQTVNVATDHEAKCDEVRRAAIRAELRSEQQQSDELRSELEREREQNQQLTEAISKCESLQSRQAQLLEEARSELEQNKQILQQQLEEARSELTQNKRIMHQQLEEVRSELAQNKRKLMETEEVESKLAAMRLTEASRLSKTLVQSTLIEAERLSPGERLNPSMILHKGPFCGRRKLQN